MILCMAILTMCFVAKKINCHYRLNQDHHYSNVKILSNLNNNTFMIEKTEYPVVKTIPLNTTANPPKTIRLFLVPIKTGKPVFAGLL